MNGWADGVAEARKDPRERALLPCQDGIKKYSSKTPSKVRKAGMTKCVK